MPYPSTPAATPHPYRTLFQLKGYSSIFGLRLFSALSGWTDATLIYVLLIGHFHATALEIGLTSACMWLPMMVLGPLAGSIADRWPIQRVLYAGIMARVGAAFLLMSAPSVGVFIGAVLLRATSNLGSSSMPLATRRIVPRPLLSDNARLAITVDQGTRLIAPLVASGLGFLPQPQYGFCITIALGCLALMLATSLRNTLASHDLAKVHSQASKMATGRASAWKLIMASPALRLTLWTATAYAFTIGLLDPLLALMLKSLPEGAQSYGLVMGLTSVGAIAGAHYAPRARKRWGHIQVMQSCLAITGAMTAFTAMIVIFGTISVWFIAFYWMIAGVCYAATLTCFGVALQSDAPTERIGAISASLQSSRLAALATGPLMGAVLAQYLGIGAALLCATGFALTSGATLQRMARAHYVR